ncbi:transporter substrate-binding domain-containing protein [Niveispirillum sp. SYP-B3756]|uniref:ABC transporter substrate-binding protein n=1 Tax=Niveispirillum sp. SYP-B3756 TaxID=2662178 RepID=UPI001291D9F9|nr:ABC transporter substrate-binding protein [Niveispirillum sp. SYP-B3756]MQP64655.1 transporter substrate-binding domain-containing protein [Niveispirillum sp. SYP-B3756]
MKPAKLLSLCAATVALCALAPAAMAADDVIRVGNLKLAHFGAVSYVQEIAPSCGIKVETKIFAKGPDVMQAILAGELDVGATASEAAISGRANGAPIYIVAGFAKGGARLVAAADSGIKSVADLKGKKVGVTRGSIQEVLLAAELDKAGLSSSDRGDKDVTITYLGYPDLNQALLLKQLDAIMQTEPQSSQAIGAGFGTEVIKPYDTPIGSPVRTMVMSEKFMKEKPELAQKYLACFVKATKTFMDSPATASKFVRETLFGGQLKEADFDAAIGNAPYTLGITAEHIQATTDTMKAHGIGKMSKPPVAKEFVRTELLDLAMQQVK